MKRLLSMLLIIIMVTTCCSPAFASERTLVDSTSDGKQRVREIQELRQENSDTYLLSDGTCECVVYSEDKYFKNENGNYVVINNAVKPEKYKSVSNDYGFANAANSFKVRFSDKKASVLITTESECLAFSLINSEPKNVKTGAEGNSYRFQEFNLRSNNCITYVDAYKDTDIIYSVQNDYVKEYIVLKSPAAQSEFLFEVDTSNYDIIKENNGNLRVCNKNGTPVFDFGSLFAVDSAGNYTDKLEYTVLKSTDNNTMIKVSFTSDYLEEADRVFPVLIDPSVMVTGANKTKDSFVSSRYPSTNYYMQNWLKTGHDEDFGIRRSYVKFTLPDNITNSSIISAYINIKYYSGSAPKLEAYRVIGSWTSNSLTWNNRPRYNTVNSSTGMTALSNDWYRLYVTDIVRGWYVGDYNNLGFVIKDKTESTTSHWTTFYSSDAASPNKPELHITYNTYYGTRPYQSAPYGGAANCMGYALEYKQFIDVKALGLNKEDMYGKTTAQMLAFVSSKAQAWMNANIGSENYSRIAAYDSNINSGWFRIVLRVGFNDKNGNGVFDETEEWDYHWRYQTNENNGQWAEKRGSTASQRVVNSAGSDPAAQVWYGFYNSSGVYFQVKDIRTINW